MPDDDEFDAAEDDAAEDDDFEADWLDPEDLIPAEGGTWSGLLFDSPRIGLPAALTWSFNFEFAEVSGSPVSVDIGWVPFAVASWQSLAGQVVRQAGPPVEGSVYYFTHHRFHRTDLEVAEQRGETIHARAMLSGDLDGLGLPTVPADAWLGFSGITVQLGDIGTPEAALARLRDFTDPTGLALVPGPGNANGSFRFAP